MVRKYFIYIAIAVLLIAWYYRASIKDSIVHIKNSVVHNVKNVRKASPFTDDRIEGDIKKAMDMDR